MEGARARAVVVLLAFGCFATVMVSAGRASAATVVRTFESDPVGKVPPGCVTPKGSLDAVVTDKVGYHSKRSLYMRTGSGISCAQSGRRGAEFAFAVNPRGAFTVAVLGHFSGISAAQTVFSVNVDAAGTVSWYDGVRATSVSAKGALPRGRWSRLELRIPVDNSRASLYSDDRYLGDAGPVGVRAVADVAGYQVTAAADTHLDNIGFGPGVDAAPPSTEPFQVGAARTIASSPNTVQMPNTAVLTDTGRVLLSYPAHTDVSDTNGNQFAYSDDHGASWVPAQRHNPMPDAPSYNMSRLRDGTLLVTNYHTYMRQGNTKAEFDVSTSRDGGRTWTAHTAVMSTPTAMRPISTVTDRPGSPLGGFVLVHKVIEDPDGTFYQSAYGYYADDAKYRQLLLASHDHGASWTVRSTIAFNPKLSTDPGYEGFCEAAVERVADGSLLAVMRTGGYLPMYTARSTDNGASWSAPAQLLAGRDRQSVASVYPSMRLLPDGKLVLLVGRPGLTLLSSPDGSGRTWTRPVTVDYANSANGAFLPIDRNHLLVFGDRGANWSQPTPKTYQVWTRLVTIDDH